MSMVALGANTQMLCNEASGSAGSGTELTGIAAGTGNISSSATFNTRDTPGGRGVLAGKVTNDRTITFTVATDSNETHDPQFRAGMGQRRWMTFRPKRGSGNVQQFFQAVIMPTLTIDPTTDACTWSVAVTVDGPTLVENTQ